MVYALGSRGECSAPLIRFPLPRAVTDTLATDGVEVPGFLNQGVLLEIEKRLGGNVDYPTLGERRWLIAA